MTFTHDRGARMIEQSVLVAKLDPIQQAGPKAGRRAEAGEHGQ